MPLGSALVLYCSQETMGSKANVSSLEKARACLLAELRDEIGDQRVLDAIARVPRERFLLPEMQPFAYDNRPLPIGYGQTISQPLIVAMMTDALALTGREKVLEVGAGSAADASADRPTSWGRSRMKRIHRGMARAPMSSDRKRNDVCQSAWI